MEIDLNDLKFVAKILMTDCDNPEYCRGICELLANFCGDEDGDTSQIAMDVAKELEVDTHNIDKFY